MSPKVDLEFVGLKKNSWIYRLSFVAAAAAAVIFSPRVRNFGMGSSLNNK